MSTDLFYKWWIPYNEHGAQTKDAARDAWDESWKECSKAYELMIATWMNCKSNGHTFYTDADVYKPNSILDRNGQVVLKMCKLCNKAESELA